MKRFTLPEILLLAGAAGFFIIWLLEVFDGRVGWKESYFWAMLSLGLLMLFQLVKNKRLLREKENQGPTVPRKKK